MLRNPSKLLRGFIDDLHLREQLLRLANLRHLAWAQFGELLSGRGQCSTGGRGVIVDANDRVYSSPEVGEAIIEPIHALEELLAETLDLLGVRLYLNVSPSTRYSPKKGN